ncbi:MAG: hypothetical protein M1160_01885 [Candidatus Marsarchaeota archaeon]|nr:hypothetical protein [Candidatus Marsarchaeota archaeon]MCL5111612.1 hypothetical protein [Candidatus Marsarchaeota archaeon]
MSKAILRYLALMLFSAIIAFQLAAAQGPGMPFVGTASIMAPAVTANNTGALTNISVMVRSGTGKVTIIGPRSVAGDTNASAINASFTAAQYLNVSQDAYNFTYTIADYNESVSGPSAGTAMTLLAISAISGRPLLHNFTVTGTIYNGSVGPIGGVYDKASAAAAHHMKFMIVPMAAPGSEEDMLYYLIQGRFHMPVIQVANISAAAGYAFGEVPISGENTTFNPYTDYHTGLIPMANISCSNGCDAAPFSGLTNFTLNITASEIANVSGYPNATAQFRATLNQSRAIASLGYLYTAADTSFLNYIDAYYFAHSGATIDSARSILQNISGYCTSISAPPLTEQNYEWVIAGELRQTWGSYTAASTLSLFSNTSQFTTDTVLESLYSGAQASGWCSAANYMFGSASAIGGTPVHVQQSLSSTAASRISRASSYGNNLYLVTAEEAYSSKNYPLAIMDSDYAYASGLAGTTSQNMTDAQLISAASAIAHNSTYGAWAAQFANEAMFYVRESGITNSVNGSRSYALQAYSAALLAQQMSNGTKLIYQSLSPGAATTTVAPTQATQTLQFYNVQLLVLYGIFAVLVAIFIVDFIILVLVSKMLRRSRGRRPRRR